VLIKEPALAQLSWLVLGQLVAQTSESPWLLYQSSVVQSEEEHV
jgi:hypothetical protein